MDLYGNLISGFQGDWKCPDWFDTKQENPHMKTKKKKCSMETLMNFSALFP